MGRPVSIVTVPEGSLEFHRALGGEAGGYDRGERVQRKG